jgi:shikimate kinase
VRDGKPALHDASSVCGETVTARGIVLVGFMGAGKSTVGRELGLQLGWPFEDLDDRIQAREGRIIERIFHESGEAAFRQAEHHALRQLIEELGLEARVAALGGGAFVQANNLALLESSGLPTVFLDAPPEELFRRCEEQGTNRPLQRDRERFLQLYTQRQPHYCKASIRIETTGKAVHSVAEEIIERLGLLPRSLNTSRSHR